MSAEAHFLNLKKIALTALRAVRPFLKLTGTQNAAWDVVTALLGDSD